MPPSPPDPTLGMLVHDVARLMRRRFTLKARESGLLLPERQCAVLVSVSRDPGINQAALAHRLDIEPIALVRMVDRLQEAGLIERRQNPKDRREWMLHLTPPAYEVVAEIRRIGSAMREEAQADLDAGQRDALLGTLQLIKANLIRKVPSEIAGGGKTATVATSVTPAARMRRRKQ